MLGHSLLVMNFHLLLSDVMNLMAVVKGKETEDEEEEVPVVVQEASEEAILKFNRYTKLGKTSEECKADHSAEGACNADAACVWCACSAVPSSCFSVDDAKKLPSAVFTCDSKEEDVPAPRQRHHRMRGGVVSNWAKLMRGEPLQDTCEYSSADECNANASECSWCISAAVKPACRTIDMAKKLPASIFQCSNLSEEEEIVEDEEEDQEEPTFMGMFRGKHHRGGKHHGQRGERQGEEHHKWGGKDHHKRHGSKAHRAFGPILLVIVMIFHFCNMRTYITKLDKMDEAKGYVSDFNPCQWSKKWNKKEGKKCKKVVVPQQQQVSQSPVIEYSIYEHNDTQVSEAPKVHYMVPKETTMMV